MINISPEINKAVNDHFWEIIAEDPMEHKDLGKWMTNGEIEAIIKDAVDVENKACLGIALVYQGACSIAERIIDAIRERGKE